MKMLPKIIDRGEESMVIDNSVRMYSTTFYPGATVSSRRAFVMTGLAVFAVLFLAIVFVFVNLVVDLSYGFLNPRIRVS